MGRVERRVRWGILGTAGIARRRFIPALRQARNAEVAAVASRRIESAEGFARELEIATAHGSYEALLADPSLDAIYIALPNSEHARWALRCADAGKPVLCEKPLARTADEASEVVEAFAQRGVPLAEGFMYRFHPLTDRVRALLDARAIGTVTAISASFTFHLTAEQNIRLDPALGGGALLDVGCYCVSLLRLLAGEEPVEVKAAGTYAPSGVDLQVAGVLRFPSGALGHFDCGLRGARAQGYEVRGTEGRIVVERGFTMEPAETPRLRLERAGGVEEEVLPATNHFVRMIEAFQGSMRDGTPPRFPAEDAVKNLRVLDALAASARPDHPGI